MKRGNVEEVWEGNGGSEGMENRGWIGRRGKRSKEERESKKGKEIFVNYELIRGNYNGTEVVGLHKSRGCSGRGGMVKRVGK